MIYMPVGFPFFLKGSCTFTPISKHTFMVTDHKQSFDFGLTFAEAEEDRIQRRSVIFPDLPPYVIQIDLIKMYLSDYTATETFLSSQISIR